MTTHDAPPTNDARTSSSGGPDTPADAVAAGNTGAPLDPRQEEQSILYVGMDLGTSRTAVAASNGTREDTFSTIGYPKDVVSRKLLGDGPLFGAEAMAKRLSLSMYRPLEKGVIKAGGEDDDGNAKAARDLVQHAIRLAKPRPDQLVYAVIGTPAEASIKNRKAILDAAKEVVDSVIIASEPFAVAYGLDILTDALVIDIGAGTVDLCRMHGTMPEPEDQITLSHAGDAVDKVLADLIRKNHPELQFSERMVSAAKEQYATVRKSDGNIVVTWPVNGKPTEVDITAEMHEACHSIVPPIADALGKLVASFDPEFQSVLRGNVLLGGGGSRIRGLGDALAAYMTEHLGGGNVTTVEEPVYAGANGALKIGRDMPAEYWEQLA